MSEGSVLLNADLVRELLRRGGHALKDFEGIDRKNKSRVAKGTWKRALNGERIRRNSWLEIARYLQVDPPDLLLHEMEATFETITTSRAMLDVDRSPSNIVVKRGDLTIVLGEDFSAFTSQKRERVWQRIYDLLGEVEPGPESDGSVLVNIIVSDDQIRQAVAYFLSGEFASVHATDLILKDSRRHEALPAGAYSTSHFTNLRMFTARILRRQHLAESDLDEIAADTMEAVFLLLRNSRTPEGSLLKLCRRLLHDSAIRLIQRRRDSRITYLSIDELNDIVDTRQHVPVRSVLREELWDRIAAVLSRPHPSRPVAAMRMRLEGNSYVDIARTLNVSIPTVYRWVQNVWRELLGDVADNLE